MPGGKYRLKALLTGGLQVGQGGSAGGDFSNIIGGSAAINVACTIAGSSAGVHVFTVTGLTACHLLHATLDGAAGCYGVVGACPGTNSASVLVANWSSSGAACGAKTVRYVAFRVRQ